jgi:hypothetical protein
MADQEVVVATPEPNAVVETPTQGAPLEPEFDYEAEFAAQAAKIDAKKQGHSDEDSDKQSAAPVTAPTPEQPAANAAPAAVDPDEEILAAIPEEKREAARARFKAAEAEKARADKLANDNRSMAGRMSAYQRKYEEAAGKRPVEVQAEQSAEQKAEWTQFVGDYPDIAKAIEARFAASQPGKNADVEAMVAYVHEERRNRFLSEAWDAVEAVHAGWRTKVATPEFAAWKSSSPTYEKLASSDDVADAIALFDLYDAHTLKSKPAPVPAVPVDPVKAAEAAKLAARRGAQAEGAKAPIGRNASPNQNVDMGDADQLFAFYADKSNRRIASRNR